MPRLNRRSRQGTTARPLRVLVAAPQPLHRELVRFFLEEAGYQVVALVARGEDAVSLATSKRPDAVILHESLVATAGGGIIQWIRQGSKSTKIVVVTPQPNQASTSPSRDADAFVEEWVGVQELGTVLQRLCRGAPIPAQPALTQPEPGTVGRHWAAGRAEELPAPPRAAVAANGWQTRWYNRLQGAVAASVILVAMFLGRGLFQPPPISAPRTGAASAHLTNAYSTLAVLVTNMRSGMPPEVIAQNARKLFEERALAIDSGADTSRLDAAIAEEVSPLLSIVTDKGAAAVAAILGDLIGDEGPPPTPEPSPGEGPNDQASPTEMSTPEQSLSSEESPSAGSSPSPDPSQVQNPEPSPTDTPSAEPSPTDTPSAEPSPTDTPSAEPSPAETPSPFEAQSSFPSQTSAPSTNPSSAETPSSSETPSPELSPTESWSPTESPSPTESQTATESESPEPDESESPEEPSESESPSVGAPTTVPTAPSAAGLLVVGLPLLAWIRARARQ